MLIILSPAKKLDMGDWDTTLPVSTPQLLDDTASLIAQLRDYSPDEIADLMHLSPKLAALNYTRYQQFHTPFTPQNAKPAILAFNGDVYEGLEASHFSTDDLAFAQQHLRILSGLYGVLRPLDLMQAYRLEMGTRLATSRGKQLYAFWGSRLGAALQSAMPNDGAPALINLASQEYFKAVDRKALNAAIITPIFKERKGNTLRVIGLFAKKARGMMARYAITHRLTRAEALQDFSEGGYRFQPGLSTSTDWVFVR